MYVLGHIYSTLSSFGYREDNDLLGNPKNHYLDVSARSCFGCCAFRNGEHVCTETCIRQNSDTKALYL